MPAKVKVRILAGRNLPVMDKSSDASDAFVEVKLGNTTFKTEVYRRSLNPFWNSEWFRFEVNDQELQDEPLQIRIMDYDTYSANDAIGKVYINLNPLLVNPGRSMSGWLPIYDTLHGIRGEINCMVKVNLFADNNRYRHSSCGVRFFFSDIPNGYKCDAILGFVDELLVNDDPEYQWIDKIRTPRASNEARQTLFTKLSGEVQRKLGLKAEIFGGNAVIGYQQSFDLEGGSGIVGRGIGTAVILSKIGYPYEGIISPLHLSNHHNPYPYHSANKRLNGYQNEEYKPTKSSHSFTTQKTHPYSNRHLVHSLSADKSNSGQQHRHLNLVGDIQQNLSIDQVTRTEQAQKDNLRSAVERTKSTVTEDLSTCSGSSNQQRKSTTSSSSTKSSPNPTGSSSSSQQFSSLNTNNKRRKDKSQSTSLDDALSIIEEKVDDDEQLTIVNLSKSPSNLGGSSVAKLRPMIRSKEIDLVDDSEFVEASGGDTARKAFQFSSSSDEEDGKTFSSSSTIDGKSTVNAKQTIAGSSSSLLSTSSKSNSNLTDETVKAANEGSSTTVSILPKPTLLSQQSSPISPEPHVTPVIRRSDTDIAKYSKPGDTQRNLAASPESLNNYRLVHDKKRVRSPELRQSFSNSAYPPHQQANGNSPNFVQSVRAVKAQQQLLHQMIKHQNENLIISSNEKARNAFMYPNRVHQSEYPFVTLKRFPKNMIQCTGGVVSVHSVKLLDHIINDEESETRDIWWTEIRKEIRSLAKALNCNTILGYSETSKVLGDVCVLSAFGTAAVMRDQHQELTQEKSTYSNKHTSTSYRSHHTPSTLESNQAQQNQQASHKATASNSPTPNVSSGQPEEKVTAKEQDNNTKIYSDEELKVEEEEEVPTKIDCSFCHTPLICADSINSLTNCSVCESSKVADVLLLTIEPPENLNIVSAGSLVQARVCRAKRDSHGEASAKEIGDALPFLEYELHRQLFTKLKFKGMNCLYNLSVDISVGENMLTGVATGTGCFVIGLPAPDSPRISAGKGIKTSRLNEIQQLIAASAHRNRETLGLDKINVLLSTYRDRQNTINQFAAVRSDTENGERESINTSSSLYPSSILNGPQKDSSRNVISVEKNGLSGTNNKNKYNNLTNSEKLKAFGEELHQNQHHHKHRHHHHHHHHHRKSHERSNNHNILPPVGNLMNLLTDDNNIVLEVDDNEDADIITQLIDSDIPQGYLVCNSEAIPIIDQTNITSINMFTQVMRVKLVSMDQFAQQFDWILQALFVKLRRSLPCCLTNVNFVVDLPESQVVQISVTGCLLGLNGSPEQLLAVERISSKVFQIGNRQGDANLMISSHKAEFNQSHTSTTSMPSSSTSSSGTGTSSSSSSSSSSSGTESSETPSSQSNSSELSSSMQSVKEAEVIPTSTAPTQKGSEIAKSFTKKLSQTNIAALIGGMTGNAEKKKNNTKESVDIELSDRQAINEAMSDSINKGVNVESGKQLNQPQTARVLPTAQQSFQTMRAVFKKQQTYPGATSPAISGQDKLFPIFDFAANGPNFMQQKTSSILDKVKQPLKDLGSNFNHHITSSTSFGNTTTAAAAAGGSSNAPLTTASCSSSNLQTSSAQVKNSPKSNQQNETGVAQPAAAAPSMSKSSISQNKGKNSKRVFQNKPSVASSSNQTSIGVSTNLSSSSAAAAAGAVSSGCSPTMANASPNMVSKVDTATNSSIDITSLSYIPGAKEYHYLGNLSFSFVRETNSVRENGGLNGFIHCFLMEVYAIVRAHVSALGGNAFLSFRLQQSCIFYHSNKNQAQCLISVAGDAVQISM